MSTQLQLRRGTTAQIAAFTGASGEVTADTQTFRLQSHDGTTAGGHAIALVSDLTSLLTVPSGGTTGQVLTKTAGGFAWAAAVTGNPLVNVGSNTQVNTTFTVNDTYIRLSNTAAMTVQVPTYASQAIPVGWQTTIIQAGTGQVTVTAASGVTINSADSKTTRKQFSAVTLVKIATDTWDLIGDVVLS